MVEAASIAGRSVLPARWNPVKATTVATVAHLLTLAAWLSVSSWPAALLALLALPTNLTAQHSSWDSVVQLTQHTSPSGTYVLEVDPTTRYGAGSAHYRLRRDRETVWDREQPFTFVEASVGDDGVVAGWACTEGVRMADGELVFAVLAPDGTVRGEMRVARAYSRRQHVKPVPTPLRVLLQRQRDMALLLVVEEAVGESGIPRRYESWWRMRLSDGTPLDPIVEPTIDSSSGLSNTDDTRSSQPTPTDDWPTTLNGTSFEPTTLGEVQFDLAEDDEPTPADTHELLKIDPEDQFVDSLGNIYLLDCGTSLLHSFTATGTRRWVVPLPPNAFKSVVSVQGLAVRGDGHVLLWNWFERQRAEVDGAGHVLSPLPKPIDKDPAAASSMANLFPGRPSEVAFVPGSGRHWVLINYALELRDAEGRVQTRVERAPCVNDALRAAADGSVACIDHVLQGDAELLRVQIIEQDGSVRRTVTLTGARRSYPRIAYDGRHLVVRDGDALLVVDVDTGERQLTTLAKSHGWNPFLSPSGDEIWLFPFRSARITRIAMP
ncbi:MAG: hypothetical protein ACI9EF_002760 [Pseudohongiellaceae bacterium]|jgi:hypothetical protein